MIHGKAIRTGLLAAAFLAPAVAASYAQTAPEPEPNLAADVSQLLDWIDGGLDSGSETHAAPSPALGEGPVGRALGWLLGGDEPQPASAAPEDVPVPAVPVQATANGPATPVAAPVEDVPPDGDPLSLTPQARPVAASRPQGLLLPVAAP